MSTLDRKKEKRKQKDAETSINKQNCAKQNVAYERVNCVEITDALQLIYSHKAEIESQGTDVISAYNKLFSPLFTSLRIAVPFEREEIGRVQGILEECKVALEHEKRFMSQELYRYLVKAIANFEKVFVISFDNPTRFLGTSVHNETTQNTLLYGIQNIF